MLQEVNALEFRGITKTFPGVVALNDVSFSVGKGEVHGLVGENGAGKSTLIKILSGVYPADQGEILLNGSSIQIGSTNSAKSLGIQVIHQEISVLPNMTVAENILMHSLPRRLKMITDEKSIIKSARAVLDSIGLNSVDPMKRVGDLSLATQQMINLARVISTNPKIVLMDEPTASLTMNEVSRLFDVIRKYRDSGVTIIYISHYIDEVLKICDRISVLRDGKFISTLKAKTTSKEDVVYAMIGKNLTTTQRSNISTGNVVLKLENVSSTKRIRNISFDLHEKEILGLYGLNGAGKTETIRAIMGLDKILKGNIYYKNNNVTGQSITSISTNGMAYIPEERRRQGIILQMSVLENSTLGNERRFSSKGFINHRDERQSSMKNIERMRVKTPSIFTKIGALSGGNQQKVIMARCITKNAELYLLDEPTVGIDVGAREEIYSLISEVVSRGASAILASSDMTEILETCDRIAIITNGEIVKVLDRKEASEEKLLLYATGK